MHGVYIATVYMMMCQNEINMHACVPWFSYKSSNNVGYSLAQSEIIASLMAESLHNSLKPMWASMITQKDMVT